MNHSNDVRKRNIAQVMMTRHDTGSREREHKHQMGDHFSSAAHYWREVYGESASPDDMSAPWLRKRMTIVLSLLKMYGQDQPLRVLDAGCGAGVFLRELQKLGHVVWGVDQSVEMAREAGRAENSAGTGNGLCLVADVESLPIKECSFDAVICVGVLQYLKRDRPAIGELSRILRPGGIAIITIPNMVRLHVLLDPFYYFEYFFRMMLRLLGSRAKNPNRYGTSDFRRNRTFWNRRYLKNSLDSAFREAGFLKITTESVAFAPLTIWRREFLSRHLSSRLGNSLTELTKKPGLGWVDFFADRWVFCLRKC